MTSWFDTTDPDFTAQFTAFLGKRRQSESNLMEPVAAILRAVRERGDAAVCEYTQQWDRLSLTPQTLRVHHTEIEASIFTIGEELREALEIAADRIRDYHHRQLPADHLYTDIDGNTLGWQWKPLLSTGIYVPGGKATYPSSVLMNAIPAKVAGVKRVAMVVPAPEGYLNPVVLAAAQIAGVDEIYQIGGAQAIAALAYGTASISPVVKIVGPGNAYVAEAKRQVFGTVGIDMIAGPSEICVVADAHNHPHWIAADLLSQAEHSEDAQSILITDDENFARAVEDEIHDILATLPRSHIAAESWQHYGAIVLVNQLDDCAPIIDLIAPEHAELAIQNPSALAAKINCASAIFLGRYAPEAFGDYTAGPSHVLPTGGTAKFSSGLSVYDFMVRQTLISATETSFQNAGYAARVIAEAEGLHAHALSLQCRLK
jgi:histidinol dehydrogenase